MNAPLITTKRYFNVNETYLSNQYISILRMNKINILICVSAPIFGIIFILSGSYLRKYGQKISANEN